MNSQLLKLQSTQLEILKIIDSICRKNGIKYSLYAGTLLGAVRHKGFIPWDDDLDICMSRADYDRFISLWESSAPEGYILQNKDNTPDFQHSFTKIRKDHTTFLQFDRDRNLFHNGIFVDVFPIDRMPEGTISTKLFSLKCMFYQLYNREFVPPLSGKLTQLVCKMILMLTPKSTRVVLRRKLLRSITKNNDRRDLSTVAIETVKTAKVRFPANMLDEYTELQFEDGSFMCFADWDTHLKIKYGDYMTLPDPSERVWRHHPIILDFEKNYEELEVQNEA